MCISGPQKKLFEENYLVDEPGMYSCYDCDQLGLTLDNHPVVCIYFVLCTDTHTHTHTPTHTNTHAHTHEPQLITQRHFQLRDECTTLSYGEYPPPLSGLWTKLDKTPPQRLMDKVASTFHLKIAGENFGIFVLGFTGLLPKNMHMDHLLLMNFMSFLPPFITTTPKFSPAALSTPAVPPCVYS